LIRLYEEHYPEVMLSFFAADCLQYTVSTTKLKWLFVPIICAEKNKPTEALAFVNEQLTQTPAINHAASA